MMGTSVCARSLAWRKPDANSGVNVQLMSERGEKQCCCAFLVNDWPCICRILLLINKLNMHTRMPV